ncbi:MAG: serine protease, partial [Halioglobus sp.]|nr:serine protease [Halioglobus sp.]
MKRPRRWAALALLCACVLPGAAARADVTASDLFNATQALVYQVRVIDVGSGDKYGIGSGFAVSAGGLVATNFHVVSSFVHEPEKYRLELVRHDGTVEAVRLVSTDVIHD